MTTNRLIHEKSPYLLQHAQNPVDWFPWGDEAFQKATQEDKPILLSIGYSTCHWCHVMAHESFEDPQIAKIMNEKFVSIKVDREERPDLDHIYMSATQAITGQGGWPLTVFLTPQQKPFFGGTYFPPYPKWGSPGFIDLLNSISQAWHNNREEITQSSENLVAMLKQMGDRNNDKKSLSEEIFNQAFYQLTAAFDKIFGGFGQAPKFPMGHTLSFLLRYWKKSGEPRALAMVEQTLTQMARGGMYDHLAGGFHRYSTDHTWHVPHFEKMLYDQALLVRAYLECYQVTGTDAYATIAREILDYVLTDLQNPSGGFYSAEDADSAESLEPHAEKKEGAYYVWGAEEIEKILGANDYDIFQYAYGVKKDGNVSHDPHGEFVGKNILFRAHSVEETAFHFTREVAEIETLLSHCKTKLKEVREKRPKPHLDDKILTDWNGLMISALAFAAQVLGEPRYEKAARVATDFILAHLVSAEGRLYHRYRDNHAGILGTLEDYAFFCQGLLDVYEATLDMKYLERAYGFFESMIELFADKEQGGFFLTAKDSERLIIRPKEIYDGAIPSGNSMAALVCGRMSRMTIKATIMDYAQGIFQFFAPLIEKAPSAYTLALSALDFHLSPSLEFIFVSQDSDHENLQSMLKILNNNFLPNKVVLFKKEGAVFREEFAFLNEYSSQGHGTSVFMCHNHSCQAPVYDISEFAEMIKGK